MPPAPVTPDRRATAAVLVSLLHALGASAAHAAEPQPPGLNWVRLAGAESCISAAALAERVELRVGRVLFAPATLAFLFVDGHVRAAQGDGWDVTLEVSDAQGRVHGRRELHFAGTDCHAIDEAVALVIAVTLYPNTNLLEGGIPLEPGTASRLEALFGSEPVDPDPGSLGGPPAQAAPAEVAASPAARRTADVVKAAAGSAPRTRSSPWLFGMDAAAAGGLGQLPGVAGGASVHLSLEPPAGPRLELGVLYLPGTTVEASGGLGQARFDLVSGTLSVCPWQPDWLRALSLCGGAEVGRLQVKSEAFMAGNAEFRDAVANLTGSAVLRVALAGGLHLRAALVLMLPLQQRSYTFETPGYSQSLLFRMPQVAARAEAGLAMVL